MKKLLAFVLAMTIILSLGVVAYAAPSPSRGGGSSSSSAAVVSSYDLPARTQRYFKGEDGKKITIVANGDLTSEQRDIVNEALTVVTADGALPVDSYLIIVDEDGQTYVLVELRTGEVVYVVYDKDNVSKFAPGDLDSVGANRYKVPVEPGFSTLVIAKEK
jgi:hypothetical protein